MTDRLMGKAVIVTGSTRGIGRCIAEIIANEGAVVVVTGRNEERGEKCANHIRSEGGQAFYIQVDLTVEDQVEAMVTTVQNRCGQIHGLVNNAATLEDEARIEAPLSEVSFENWQTSLHNSLTPVFLPSKHVLRAMVDGGHSGAIVNIGSIAGLRGISGYSGYATAKGGLIALTRAVASYYARYDIRCNVLSVGAIHTGNKRLSQIEESPGYNLRGLQLGLMGTPSDVAWAAVYLLADESRFVTGANLPIDGGLSEMSHVDLPHLNFDLQGRPRKRRWYPGWEETEMWFGG